MQMFIRSSGKFLKCLKMLNINYSKCHKGSNVATE